MAAVAAAESWAAMHVTMLQAILDSPERDHDVRSVLPAEEVRVAHVVGLFGQLVKRPGGPWKKHYEGRLKGGQHVAIHTWLYHLGGGAAAKLVQPTGVYHDSNRLVQRIETKVTRHKLLRTEAASRGSDADLQQLYADALEPFDWAWLRTSEAAPSADGGGGGDGAQPTLAERSVAERDLRWLVACAAFRPTSPFYALGGHGDILFTICEMACIGGMARWAPLRFGALLEWWPCFPMPLSHTRARGFSSMTLCIAK